MVGNIGEHGHGDVWRRRVKNDVDEVERRGYRHNVFLGG